MKNNLLEVLLKNRKLDDIINNSAIKIAEIGYRSSYNGFKSIGYQ